MGNETNCWTRFWRNPLHLDGFRKATCMVGAAIICFLITNNIHGALYTFYGAFILRLSYSLKTPGHLYKHRFKSAVAMLVITLVAWFVCRHFPTLFLPLLVLFSFVFTMLGAWGESGAVFGSALIITFLFGGGLSDANSLRGQIVIVAAFSGGAFFYAIAMTLLDKWRPIYDTRWAVSTMLAKLSAYSQAKAQYLRETTGDNVAKMIKCEEMMLSHQEVARTLVYRTLSQDYNETERQLVEIYSEASELFYDLEMLTYKDKAWTDLQLPNIAQALRCLADNLVNHNINLPSLSNELSQENSLTATIEKRINNLAELLASKEANNHVSYQTWQQERFIPDLTWRWHKIKAAFTWSNDVFRQATRLVFGLVAAIAVNHFLPFGHSEWLLLAIIIVSKANYTVSYKKGYERLFGNIIGVILGVVFLIWMANNLLAIVVVGIVLEYLAMVGNNYSYKYYGIFYVFSRMIILNLGGVYSPWQGFYRVEDNIVGIIFVLVLTWLIPDTQQGALPQRIAKLLRGAAAYLQQITLEAQQKADKLEFIFARREMHRNFHSLLSLQASLQKGLARQKKFITQNKGYIMQCRVLNAVLAQMSALALYQKQAIAEKTLVNLNQCQQQIFDLANVWQQISVEQLVPNSQAENLSEGEIIRWEEGVQSLTLVLAILAPNNN